MENYSALKNTKLLFAQSGFDDSYEDEVRYMEELRMRDSLDLMSKNQKILFLEERVAQLDKLERNYIPFKELCNEAKLLYADLDAIQYANTFSSNFEAIDTLAVFQVRWNDTTDIVVKQKQRKGLEQWLKFKLKLDTLVVQELLP